MCFAGGYIACARLEAPAERATASGGGLHPDTAEEDEPGPAVQTVQGAEVAAEVAQQ